MNIKIDIKNQGMQIPNGVLEACGKDELIAKLFLNRGFDSPEIVNEMLHSEFYSPTKPHEFDGMKNAIDRIEKAIRNKELICIYGDYDVDGVTSTVILVQCIRNFTDAVIYHVPDRFSEGYGMNAEVIAELARKRVDLIVTCDCGIANVAEISLANDLGMEVIITDHHNIPDELPKASVILNPKMLDKSHRARNICGCGMAYLVCLGLSERMGAELNGDEFLDLLAVATIADVVKLTDENRYLLKKALPALFNTKRPGLRALIDIAERNSALTNEEDVAFQIAPRINAAGRMDSATLPVELFLSDNSELCKNMATKIDLLNAERKNMQKSIIDQAVEMVEIKKKYNNILVLYNEFWHHGIIGIAAGRICELYNRPTILLSMKEDGDTVVGSARSVEGIDICSIIKECSSKLLKFGGHSQAAGLSLRKSDVEEFTKQIEQFAQNEYYLGDSVLTNVDAELDIGLVDEDLYEKILSIGPFGEGFEKPKFVARGVSVLSDRKTDKNHHIMVLTSDGNKRISAVKWFGEDENYEGKVVDITYKIGRNSYVTKSGNSESGIQLSLEYLLETQGIAAPVFKGNIIDERGNDIEKLIKKYRNAGVFYEGLGINCSVSDVMDRNSIRKCENLILLSTPVNTAIFREVVSLADPANIILNFSISPDYSINGFLRNLLGIIKYVVNNRNSIIEFEDLQKKLCVEESVLRSALKYLGSQGRMVYDIDSFAGKVFFGKGNNIMDDSLMVSERNLKKALNEKEAFKQFITKVEVDCFKQYLR